MPWKSRVAFAGGSVFVLILWSVLVLIIQRRWVRFEVSREGIREVRWLGPPRELAWDEIARAAIRFKTNDLLLEGASGNLTFLIDASWNNVERLLESVKPRPFWRKGVSCIGTVSTASVPAQQVEGWPTGQVSLPLELKTWRYLLRVIPIGLVMISSTVIFWTIGKPDSSTAIWRILAPLVVGLVIVRGLKSWYRVRADESGFAVSYPFRSKAITWEDVSGVTLAHGVDRRRIGGQQIGLFRQTLTVFRLRAKPFLLRPGELLAPIHEALTQELARRQNGR